MGGFQLIKQIMLFLLLLLLSSIHNDGDVVISAFVATPLSSVMVASTCVSSRSSRRMTYHHPAMTTSIDQNIESSSSSSLSPSDIESLSTKGYVIIPNFIPQSLVSELRQDILTLRSLNLFKVAKIGQDATNELNTNIRIAETCFIGRNRKELTSVSTTTTTTTTKDSSVRDRPGGLYDILDNLRMTLDTLDPMSSSKLDINLMELLYVYYPQGGYYRRHRDAVPNSASALRKYSLLLYLNPPSWDPIDNAGQLRLHLDGGNDDRPPTNVVRPNYIDVNPLGGTLVLFKSEAIPHEVLNTNAERYALVGWYNRRVSVTDIGNLGVGIAGGGVGDTARLAALVLAMTLVTYGVVSII